MKYIRILKSYLVLFKCLFLFNRKRSKIVLMIIQLHSGQKRYGGEPYWVHPLRVSLLTNKYISNHPLSVEISLLHDVIEDCDISKKDLTLSLQMIGYNKDASDLIVSSVLELSNVYTSKRFPSMKRDKRKEREGIRLSKCSNLSISIKLLDILDNVKDSKHLDKRFLKLYKNEQKRLYFKLQSYSDIGYNVKSISDEIFNNIN